MTSTLLNKLFANPHFLKATFPNDVLIRQILSNVFLLEFRTAANVYVMDMRQQALMRISPSFASLATLFSNGGGVFYRSAANPSEAFL